MLFPFPTVMVGPYSEVGNLGITVSSGVGANISANQKAVSHTVTVPVGGVWVKTCLFQIRTAISGKKIRPVLYSGSGASTDTLFATAQEYTFPASIASSTQVGPINWNADGSALFLPAGEYTFGAMSDGSLQFDCVNTFAAGQFMVASDTYSDGAAATYGTITAANAKIHAWIPYSLSP